MIIPCCFWETMFCRHTHNYQCSVFQLMFWRMIRIKGVKIVWSPKNAWGAQFVSTGAETPPPSLIVRSSCLHWSNHRIMAMPQKRFPPRKRHIHIPCKVSMGSGAICCLSLASDSFVLLMAHSTTRGRHRHVQHSNNDAFSIWAKILC